MGFREYIRSTFNQLDFFIVVTSTMDMVGEAMREEGEDASGASLFKLFRVFRLFRVLRVARILYRNANLKRVLVTVFGSGEALANLVTFIMFTVLLFAGSKQRNFCTCPCQLHLIAAFNFISVLLACVDELRCDCSTWHAPPWRLLSSRQ
jgi:hypothetical protein|eukprot:SAG25_NODE_1885_length_2204_cov_9.949631_3_plen_150_part_00